MMLPIDSEKAILRAAYTAYFAGEGSVGLHEIRDTIGAEKDAYEQVVKDLENRGLIKPHAFGWYNRITPHGILSAEDWGFIEEEIAQKNREARINILDYLVRAAEGEKNHYGRPYEQIASDLRLDTSIVRPNLTLLTEFRHILAKGGGIFAIAPSGVQIIRDWREKAAVAEEFAKISKLSPQARGRELQRFFARQVGRYGWDQEEGARSTNEEIDVVLHKDNIYYIVECKWEKDPIEAKVVRELFGKLNNRAAVKGIVVSMSGFRSGAVKQAEDYAGQATILFFGPKDVQTIVDFEGSLDQLLNQKLKDLVIRRKVTSN